MAKKGNRVQVILECTEIQDRWSAWYQSLHNKEKQENTPERLELNHIPNLEEGYSTKKLNSVYLLRHILNLLTK